MLLSFALSLSHTHTHTHTQTHAHTQADQAGAQAHWVKGVMDKEQGVNAAVRSAGHHSSAKVIVLVLDGYDHDFLGDRWFAPLIEAFDGITAAIRVPQNSRVVVLRTAECDDALWARLLPAAEVAFLEL